jgi:hypothetical protein
MLEQARHGAAKLGQLHPACDQQVHQPIEQMQHPCARDTPDTASPPGKPFSCSRVHARSNCSGSASSLIHRFQRPTVRREH